MQTVLVSSAVHAAEDGSLSARSGIYHLDVIIPKVRERMEEE